MRPYEPLTGMSTLKWMTIPAEYVDVELIIPCQHHLSPEWKPGMSWTRDLPVYLVHFENKLWTVDGHNRIAWAKKNGQKKILARVLYKINDRLLVPLKVAC